MIVSHTTSADSEDMAVERRMAVHEVLPMRAVAFHIEGK